MTSRCACAAGGAAFDRERVRVSAPRARAATAMAAPTGGWGCGRNRPTQVGDRGAERDIRLVIGSRQATQVLGTVRRLAGLRVLVDSFLCLFYLFISFLILFYSIFFYLFVC